MSDQYNLQRFADAQKRDYETALYEIRQGRKRSHWIWYIFPQIIGLGRSSTAVYYSITCREEAQEYMCHPVLRAHLLEISEALLTLEENNPRTVMGYPDNRKLHSSMTLFSIVCPEEQVFQRVLDKYFSGKKDSNTVRILQSM